MRPLVIGIILFLAWLIISSWYYSRHIFPVDETVQETISEAAVPEPAVLPPDEPVLPEIPGDITLYFDFNKTAILNPDALGTFMQECRAYLDADSNACLILTGHTCDIGTATYNMDLGMRRASSVRAYLLGDSETVVCIELLSKGEEDPAEENSTETNRKLNRRVVAHINH